MLSRSIDKYRQDAEHFDGRFSSTVPDLTSARAPSDLENQRPISRAFETFGEGGQPVVLSRDTNNVVEKVASI